MSNLSAAVIPAGMNLRVLYARTPMITASVPLDANITMSQRQHNTFGDGEMKCQKVIKSEKLLTV